MFISGIHFTFSNPIIVINIQPDQQPHKQSDPGIKRQERHECQTYQNSQSRHIRNKRNFKSSGHIFHGISGNQHSGTNQDKGEKRSYTHHFSHHSARNKSSKNTDKQHNQQTGFIRSSEFWMRSEEHTSELQS